MNTSRSVVFSGLLQKMDTSLASFVCSYMLSCMCRRFRAHFVSTCPGCASQMNASAASLMQKTEPSLAGFVHSYVLMHTPEGLGRALASLLANKLSSRTLLPMQLAGLFLQAYSEDEVIDTSSPT